MSPAISRIVMKIVTVIRPAAIGDISSANESKNTT